MNRINRILLFLLIIIFIFLLILLGYYYLTCKKLNSISPADLAGTEARQEIGTIKSEDYNDETMTGIRRSPIDVNRILVEGYFVSFENNLLTIDTGAKKHALGIQNDIKVLVIDESLSGEEQLNNLYGIEVGELVEGDKIIATCLKDQNNNLIVESLQKNIY